MQPTTTTTGYKTSITGGLVDLINTRGRNIGLDVVHTLGGNVAVEMMDVLAGIETAGTVQDLINTSTQMRFKISPLLLDCINIQQHCVIICTYTPLIVVCI